jgi:DNA invertase Pin-like site-specific DNA recombinase
MPIRMKLLVKEFSDVGYSGKNIDRPELQEMLHYLSNTDEKIEQLIIYSIDRFGRDMKNNIETILEILQLVDRVIFVSQNITSDSSYFKLLFLALTSVAEDERIRILKRTSDGRKAKVINRKSFDGNYLPLGYIKKEGSERLVPATTLQTVEYEEIKQILEVQYIFYLYLFDYSLRKIAIILNEKFGKTRRGKQWSYKSVQYILSNPIYTGTLRGKLEGNNHYMEENANVVEVIDPLTFSYVQAKKLEFERVGRKKRILSRNPFLNLCFQCGSFFSEEGNFLSCEKCKIPINKATIIDVIEEKRK